MGRLYSPLLEFRSQRPSRPGRPRRDARVPPRITRAGGRERAGSVCVCVWRWWGGRGGAVPAARREGVCPHPGPPAPLVPPPGAPSAAPHPRPSARRPPRLAPLDVMWVAGWLALRGRGPERVLNFGLKSAPCALRRAPGSPRAAAAAATSGSVQRVCFQRAGRAGAGRGGRGRGAAGLGWAAVSAALSRAPGVSLSLPLQKQLPARTALGAARPGAAAAAPLPACSPSGVAGSF